jgi:hypothetical protein
LELDRRFLRKTSPKRIHSRDQFLHGERFRKVIIRAQSEAYYPIAHLATRGQDKDTSVHFRTAQTSQHFEAIHPWQHYIEHNQIVVRCLRFAQGSFAVVGNSQLMASLGEGAKDMPCKANFVFDN